jgi:hypothetical protein
MNNYYSLLNFIESENTLTYLFENNTQLIFNKNNNIIKIIFITYLNNNKIEYIFDMNSIIIKYYKPILMDTQEFDKIVDFIKIK